jgi:DNA-binding transcriptional LysR family regulator
MFDIKQLIVFVTVAEQASFSKAAKILGVAQASVSERIAGLEKAVGARLFDRPGRRTELTDAGELLMPRARQIIALKDRTVGEIEAFLGLGGGSVSLGGSTAPGEYRLPALLGSFAAKYPEISVRLSVGDSDRVIERVEGGELHIGVVGKRVSGSALTVKKTWTDRLVLAVRSEHRWAGRRKPVSAEELAAEPWIVREPGSATRSVAETFLKKALPDGGQSLKVVAELGSVGAIKQGLLAGLGVALMSEMTIASELESGALRTAKVDGLAVERSFYLVRDRRRTQSPAAAALWKHIVAAAREG